MENVELDRSESQLVPITDDSQNETHEGCLNSVQKQPTEEEMREIIMREIRLHEEENKRLYEEAKKRKEEEDKRMNEENERIWEEAKNIVVTEEVANRALNQMEFIRRELSKKYGYNMPPISQMFNKEQFMKKFNE